MIFGEVRLYFHVVFGGLAIMVTCRDCRSVGFASPAFAGFALIVRIADLDLLKKMASL